MANYNLKAYFRGETESGCTQYIVRFVPTFQQHWPWVEVSLAGDNPVVVRYEAQESPFEPIMQSRCTINAVSSDYFFDLYGDDPQHTMVTLATIDDDNNEHLEWCGYLTNNLLNVAQDDCYNVVTLEAIDCISTLKYLDYEPLSGKKQIVSFQDILDDILISCRGQMQHVCVDSTMKMSQQNIINMSQLKISEQNFFSSDTDEPWTKYEVLEEMCRYCGYTALQWKDTVYLYDRQAHTGMEWTVSSAVNMVCISQLYSFNSAGTITHSGDTNTVYCYDINGTNIMGTGSDISLKTIYNTVTVQDSFYEIDEFLPDMMDDGYLINKDGDSWLCHKIVKSPPYEPTYVNKRNTLKNDKSETGYEFWQRTYWHKWYSSVYRDKSTLALSPESNTPWRNLGCNFIWGQGWATAFTQTINVYNRTDSERSIDVKWKSNSTEIGTVTHTIAPNEFAAYEFSWDNCGGQVGTIYFSVDNGDWHINSTHNSGEMTKDRIGATIVDFGSTTISIPSLYNYEVESNLAFDRYILIAQNDKPDNDKCNPRYGGFTVAQLNAYFPKIMELNSGYTKPIIIDDKCYLTIDTTALFERYRNKDYINKDWVGDCTGFGGDYNVSSWNIFTGENDVWTCPGALVFKLKIGDYWWNGSSWTTTERPFYVDLHTPTDDNGFIDFSSWWNTDMGVINNVSWADFAGAEGYKIPLTGVTFDFNEDIVFQICLPSKIQAYSGTHSTWHNGMNSYCWLRDFKIGFATKGSENYDLSDIVYENVIDEYSVNTLSDITLKFTTYPGYGQHSYSNVGYNGVLMNKCLKEGLDGQLNVMEENIVKMYVNQCNTNTIEETMTIDLKATPMSRLKDTENGKYFHVCGTEIDYSMGRQTVNLIESKKWNQVE